MSTSLHRYGIHSLLIACLVAPLGCGGGSPLTSPYVGDVRTPPAASVPLFDESQILDFKLTFADAEWAMFQQIHSNPPPPEMRDTYTKVYVHCGFAALGMQFPDAACRPKGNPQSWHLELKPQFVVKFDHWDTKGRFLGLRDLNLEASPATVAPVRDRQGMWLMRQFGIKASRVNHVRVFKNDVLLGLYMNIEDVDQEFLQWQFPDHQGNLYGQGFKLQNNKKMPDDSRLVALDALVANEPLDGDHGQFFAAFDAMVDVPALLAETAAEVVLPTGDNWSNGGTNYFWYDDPQTKKFILLPWDLDTSMDATYAPANADIYAFFGAADLQLGPNKYLQLIYQKSEWKKAFEDNLVKARDGVYGKLPAYIESMCAQIRDAFIADPNKEPTGDDFDKDCAYLKKAVVDRTAFIHNALNR